MTRGVGPVKRGERISERQLEVLRLIAQGLDCQQVADRLGIHPGTVRTHLCYASRFYGVRFRHQAVLAAIRTGLLTTDDALPDYRGPSYRDAPTGKTNQSWLPSPAQRCYLLAFDELLMRRDARSAVAVELAFRLMCWERGRPVPVRHAVPVRDAAACDNIDAMLIGIGRAVTRRIPT